MSAPDPAIVPVPLGIVQVAPWRGGDAALAERLQTAGWALPGFGEVWSAPGRLACSVRPRRWLLVSETAPEALAAACEAAVAGTGAVTDLTAARRSWRVTDPRAREWLAAGCRLDLDPSVFPTGRATVTLIAQVPVMLASLTDGWLLTAPSSMAGHFGDWLRHAAHTASQGR